MVFLVKALNLKTKIFINFTKILNCVLNLNFWNFILL